MVSLIAVPTQYAPQASSSAFLSPPGSAVVGVLSTPSGAFSPVVLPVMAGLGRCCAVRRWFASMTLAGGCSRILTGGDLFGWMHMRSY